MPAPMRPPPTWSGVARGIVALSMALAYPRAAMAQREVVAGRVRAVEAEAVEIDVGRERGLAPGDTGVVVRTGGELDRIDPVVLRERVVVARVRVEEAGEGTARLRVIALLSADGPQRGDWALIEGGAARGAEEEATAGPDGAGREAFVPLLAPPPARRVGFPEVSNVFHGRAWIRQYFQADPESSLDYSLTQAGTSGSLERILESPWNFEWSGTASYRDGDALEGSSDYRDIRLDVYRLSLYRRFDRGEFIRAGRFLPRELPGVGYIDGAQGETVLSGVLRAGVIAGLKPRRHDLDFSVQEPTGVAYLTAEAGKRGDLYYSGTGGVLASLYDGHVDRVAVLIDQRADITRRLSLFSTSEFDIDVGAAETRSETIRLTRLDVYASAPVTSYLTLRCGVDHYERPDTRAERDLLDFIDARLFDDGLWRYWVGATELLPWSCRIDGEIAFLDGDNADSAERWRLSLSRTGLPAMPRGQVTVTVYNLGGSGDEGYGGSLSGFLPIDSWDLYARPWVGFRFLESDQDSESFDFADVGLDLSWEVTRSVTFSAGVTHTFGDAVDRTAAHVGFDYRW